MRSGENRSPHVRGSVPVFDDSAAFPVLSTAAIVRRSPASGGNTHGCQVLSEKSRILVLYGSTALLCGRCTCLSDVAIVATVCACPRFSASRRVRLSASSGQARLAG